MTYKENLINRVMDLSSKNKWSEAVLEWEVTDWNFAEEMDVERCICGKENIYYLYEISNVVTKNKLYPIGSRCIKRFERKEMNTEVRVLEKMFDLQKAYESGTFINLSSDLFSRNSLEYMYEKGAFKSSKFGTSKDNYEFMLKMFNARKQPNENQAAKIRAIIINDIIPYCNKLMNDKVK